MSPAPPRRPHETHSAGRRRDRFAAITLSDGTTEALKWLGILLMTLDHINKYLLSAQVPWLFALGRIALPLFGFVLAYNLARPNAVAMGVFKRTRQRLLGYGGLATIPYIALNAPLAFGWWPLNVLFMLWVGTCLIEVVERRQRGWMLVVVPLFVIGSLLVEYWHWGTAAMLAAWYFCKKPRVFSLVLWALSLAALGIINHNGYALLVIPLLYAAGAFDVRLSRHRHMFYAFYPAHLALLWIARWVTE